MTVTTLQQTEFRAFQGVELRADDEGSEKAVVGRLIPYNVWAQVGVRFEERHAPGVFAKSIAEAAHNLPLMVQHEHQKLPVGSAREWESRDDDGLWGRWVLARTQEAMELRSLVDDGHVSGLSAGFIPVRSDWEYRDLPDLDRVTRLEARLMEASVVALPTWDEARLVLTREGRVKGRPKLDRYMAWLEEVKANAPA